MRAIQSHPPFCIFNALISRQDKPENRKKWGDNIGYIDVEPSECDPETGKCPYYTYKADATREGRALETPIHMLIASFRDQLCPRTLHNAFNRAENPHRIYIRVIEQTEEGSDLIDDAGCWARYCEDYNTNCQEYKDNVRTVHVNAKDAKGPTDARSKLSAMVNYDYVHRDEPDQLDFHRVELQDFCMQIDSHMDFSDNYDTELIFMWHRTENDYAVLSTYVADISQNNQGIRVVPNLCMVTFTSTIRNWGTKECRNLIRPKMTNAMWGAGLSFHRCHAELNVPVDPYLDGVFDGEEGSRGLRFFTHGYDVYAPDVVLVTHDYHTHQGNPVVHTWGRHRGKEEADGGEKEKVFKFREDIERERSKVQTKGTKRVNMMLGIGHSRWNEQEEAEIEQIRKSRFGIGNKRTLEQASKFSGIDLAGKKMVENKCGNLKWVPYTESPDYGVGETLMRSLTDASTLEVGKAIGGIGAAAGGLRGPGKAAADGGDGASGKEKKPFVLEKPVVKENALPTIEMRNGRALTDTAEEKKTAGVDNSASISPLLVFAMSIAFVLIFIVGMTVRRKPKNSRHKN